MLIKDICTNSNEVSYVDIIQKYLAKRYTLVYTNTVQLQVIFIRIPKIIAKILAFVVLSVLHDLRQYTGTIDVHVTVQMNKMHHAN
jgi:hypothetical protein